MALIHWHEDVAVKSFSVSGTNGKTSVKIELVSTDGYAIGRLIEQLQEAKAEQTRGDTASASPARPDRHPRGARALGHTPMLALPAPRTGDER